MDRNEAEEIEDQNYPEKLTIEIISSQKISKRAIEDSIEASSAEATWIDKKSIGVTGLWSYKCCFELEHNVERFLYVVDRFCTKFEGDAFVVADLLVKDLQDVVESDHKYLKVNHFALGTWSGLSGFFEKFTSEAANKRAHTTISRVEASFYHHRRYLEIMFKNKISGFKHCDVYKIKINYNSIRKIVIKRELRHRDAFYCAEKRKEPMEIYLHISAISVYQWNSEKDAYEEFFDGPWIRKTSFGSQGGPTFCNAFGQLRVLKLKLESDSSGAASDATYSVIRAVNVETVFANVKKLDMPENVEMVSCDKASPDIQYALACLQTLSPELYIKMRSENRKEIQEAILKLATEDENCLLTALYDIYYALDYDPIVDFKLAIEDSYKRVKSGKSNRSLITQDQLPENLYLVKKARISPSCLVYEPPTVIRVNALLRDCDPNCVMLVDLRDDDGSKLSLQSKEEADSLLKKTVFERLKRGLSVAGKAYFYLGTSRAFAENSSFLAYEASKKSKGDLSSIYERLEVKGELSEKLKILELKLTESLFAIPIEPAWVTVEESAFTGADYDLKKGIGRISKDAIQYVAEKLNVNRNSVSCIRVVHGGKSGILALDPCLEGNQIVYRKSQVAFESADTCMYIVEVSESKAAVFEKTFLSTLSSKREGVRELFSNREFLNELYQTIGDSTEVFHEMEPKDIMRRLPHFLLDNIAKAPCARLYDWKHDELFRQAVRCTQLKRLIALKELNLEISDTYELMPVVDEVGVLDGGEAFVQISDVLGKVHCLSGDILVARKDALYPSEIQAYTAICTPKLYQCYEHLKNCIVLSGRGYWPPLGRFSAGGDYADVVNLVVIANQKFSFTNNDKPVSVKISVVGESASPDSRVDDQFFKYLNYMSYNNFDEIYCALSDTLPNHSYSEACAKICLIKRNLDDFRLGGKELEPLPNVRRFPEFLKKISHLKTYSSQRPLAQLFRRMRLVDTEDLEQTDIDRTNLLLQTGFQIKGADSYFKAAEKDLAAFTKNLEAVAALYNITPDEALIGSIFSVPAKQISSERIQNLEKTLRFHVRHLMTITARQFKRAGMKKATEDEQLRKMAAYVLCSRVSPEKGGYAFCWMLPDLMKKLIEKVQPKIQGVPQTPVRKALITKVKQHMQDGTQGAVLQSLSSMISKWANHRRNKQLFTASRDDVHYVQDFLSKLVDKAYKAAWAMLECATEEDTLKNILQDPEPLLAETLRQMLLATTKYTAKEFSKDQLIVIGFQALIANTLVQVTAQSSLRPFLKVRQILKVKTVDRLMLLPIDAEDTKYIQATQGSLQEFQTLLKNMSGCEQIYIRLLPRAEADDDDFEEITAKGEWFAVENLETQMLMPDFRKIVSKLFDVSHQGHYNDGDDEY